MCTESGRIAELEREIASLQARLLQLQQLLNNKDQATSALHEDIDNLKKEVIILIHLVIQIACIDFFWFYFF